MATDTKQQRRSASITGIVSGEVQYWPANGEKKALCKFYVKTNKKLVSVTAFGQAAEFAVDNLQGEDCEVTVGGYEQGGGIIADVIELATKAPEVMDAKARRIFYAGGIEKYRQKIKEQEEHYKALGLIPTIKHDSSGKRYTAWVKPDEVVLYEDGTNEDKLEFCQRVLGPSYVFEKTRAWVGGMSLKQAMRPGFRRFLEGLVAEAASKLNYAE